VSNLDFPIKADKVTILNFPDSRPTEIHAAGCAHEAKASRIIQRDEIPSANDPYGDDWYHVAPCARKAPKVAIAT
jgi:hypothetical protein